MGLSSPWCTSEYPRVRRGIPLQHEFQFRSLNSQVLKGFERRRDCLRIVKEWSHQSDWQRKAFRWSEVRPAGTQERNIISSFLEGHSKKKLLQNSQDYFWVSFYFVKKKEEKKADLILRVALFLPTMTTGGETKVLMSRQRTKAPTMRPSLLIKSMSVILTAFADLTRNMMEIL